MPKLLPFCCTYPIFPLVFHLLTIPVPLVQSQWFFLTMSLSSFIFFFYLIHLCLHPGLLPHPALCLSLRLFDATSSKVHHFIHAMLFFFSLPAATLTPATYFFSFVPFCWLQVATVLFSFFSNRENIVLVYTVLRKEICNECQTWFHMSVTVKLIKFAIAEEMQKHYSYLDIYETLALYEIQFFKVYCFVMSS